MFPFPVPVEYNMSINKLEPKLLCTNMYTFTRALFYRNQIARAHTLVDDHPQMTTPRIYIQARNHFDERLQFA